MTFYRTVRNRDPQLDPKVMFMKKFLVLAIVILSACSSSNTESLLQTDKSTANLEQVNVQPIVADEYLISSAGIGKAKLGMTLAQLKQISESDTEFKLVSPFMVDLSAIAVSKDGLVQYYILYPAGTTSHPDRSTPTDNDPITLLMTDNYQYQTKEGVKVGMPIAEAEEIYGNAILAYNVEGESREYITFDERDSSNINFRASFFKSISDGLGFSGIYPEYPGVTYTTDKYKDDAAIAAIEVACSADCPD